MTSNAQVALQSWTPPLGVNLALGLAVLVYARGWFRLRASFPNLISMGRLAAFLAGVFSAWIAIGSPVDAFDESSLSVHMVQHLLLMAVAPPLILLGAPAIPLLQGLPQLAVRTVVAPFLRWRFVKWLGSFLSNPAICWLAATLALIGWHVPAVFELALRWDWLHHFEHACFFGTGLLFWWPVIQPWPSTPRWSRWSIPLYLFCATLPCDALSGFLAFCDRVVYSPYLSSRQLFNISPLQDQEFAAALMWVSVTIIFLVPAVVITIQILSPHQARVPDAAWDELGRIVDRHLDTPKLGAI